MQEIKSVVKRWRKLELDSWPFVLRVKEMEVETKASQSWFRLYSVLHGSLEQQEDPEQFIANLFETYVMHFFQS